MYSIIFCTKCNSTLVDVCTGNDGRDNRRIRCCDCGHEASIKGFTLGRCIEHAPTEPLNEAREDSLETR